MKRLGKSSKKGFTLVELIVVLVILAVLAAMLVPALVGYIDKAKAEKEFQTAATVYSAAQAVITEAYGKGDITKKNGTLTQAGFQETGAAEGAAATGSEYGASVTDLAGVDSNAVSAFSFTYTNYIITEGTVTINNQAYELTITNGVPKWDAPTT